MPHIFFLDFISELSPLILAKVHRRTCACIGGRGSTKLLIKQILLRISSFLLPDFGSFYMRNRCLEWWQPTWDHEKESKSISVLLNPPIMKLPISGILSLFIKKFLLSRPLWTDVLLLGVESSSLLNSPKSFMFSTNNY